MATGVFRHGIRALTHSSHSIFAKNVMVGMNSVDLARKLIQFPSLNPPGEEKACVDFLANMLTIAGLLVETHEFAPNRPSIIARSPTGGEKPLCFTGHVDVVPLGEKEWTVPPFGGEIRDGKLFGRGASDMKAGVAAFVTATMAQIESGVALKRGIALVITAGEETGCQGAFHLAKKGALGKSDLLIVAEPSSNLPIIAHKGSVRLRITAKGRTAHSSMPELGDNAIYKVAEWIRRLEQHKFASQEHPLLGSTTASVTTVFGGQNINSVPDSAGFTVDFRTIPAHDHSQLVADVQKLCGDAARVEVVTDFNGFATDPDDRRIQPLMDILESRLGARPKVAGAPYFTDASALVPGFGNVATVVIGPGEAAQCHQTDEFCYIHQIEEAFDIYSSLIRKLCT